MEVQDYPNLLTVSELVKPIDISIKRLNEIKNHLSADLKEIFIHGTFVLAFSQIEVMISDVLKCYLMNFPKKLLTDFKFTKDEFFQNKFDLLEKLIDDYLHNLFYEPVGKYLIKTLEHLSIEWDYFQDSFGNDLQAIKNNRNLLLHTGISSLSDGHDVIDYSYVIKSIDKFLNFEEKLKNSVKEKYKSYTKINANKKLWKFMFTTPLMSSYDEYWHYDESKDTIVGFKKCEHEGGLSSSETMLLELWRSHFNNSDIKSFNMKHLVGTTREKALFFLSIANEFRFW